MRIFAIDTGKTRRNVEEWVEEALRFRRTARIRREAKLTASYGNLAGGCSTGTVSRQTEDIAVWNVDYEALAAEKERLLLEAIEALAPDEREIMEARYLQQDNINDYAAMQALCLAESTYRRRKSRAIYSIALMLNLEVYKCQEKFDR